MALEDLVQKNYPANKEFVFEAFEQVGMKLSEFYQRYHMQHSDFQLSNIFYEASSKTVTFIDLGGMGMKTLDTDFQHFIDSLYLFKKFYDDDLYSVGKLYFERGHRK